VLSLIDERQRRLVLDSLWLGVVGAGAAQVLMWLLHLAQQLLLTGLAGLPSAGAAPRGRRAARADRAAWLVADFPLVTTLGGLISGVLVFSLAPEAEGHAPTQRCNPTTARAAICARLSRR